MEYEGCKILAFTDYTTEVMEQRQSFCEVMQLLRDKEIRFARVLGRGTVVSTIGLLTHITG